MKKLLFFVMMPISLCSQSLMKGNIVVNPYYGFRAKDYAFNSKEFKRSDVKTVNTNTIGIKGNYFFVDWFSVGLNFSYKYQSLKNDKLIYDSVYTFLEGHIYYSPENGRSSLQTFTLDINANFHVIRNEGFNWSFGLAMGSVSEKYQSNVDQNMINYINEEAEKNNDDFTYYTYKEFPKRKWMPYSLRVYSNFLFKLSPKVGLNLELGLGGYNLGLGFYYKLK